MALGRIETRPLFAIKLTVAPLQELGGDAARGRRVAVATGHRYPDGPLYSVFEVL